MPKVSIIVPVYNIENYIDICLNSLVNQTLDDIQLIVVDDGSQDGSSTIIEKYKEIYPDRITIIHKENGGLSDARNTGMQYATGTYIGFVDGDDYIEPDMYAKMYTKAEKENADLVECDFIWEYPERQKEDVGKIYNIDNMLVQARVLAWNKLIKREIIEKNHLKYPMGLRYEDVEFFYKMVPYINSVGFVKEPLYHYIQRSNSILHTHDKQTRDIFNILENVLQYYQEKGFYDRYKEQLEYVYVRYLLGSSFLRVVKIEDKSARRSVLDETLEILNAQFPHWKKNTILKNSTLLKDLYFRSVNKFTYPLYSKLFTLIDMH